MEPGTETPANGTPAKPATPETRTIPYATFRAEREKRQAAEGALETATTQITELAGRAATADTLAEQIAKIQGEHKTAAAAWAEERALLGAGVTDAEDLDLVRFHYGRLPADTKPKTIGDYVTGLRAPEAAIPKGLGHIFTRTPEADAAKPPVVKPKPPNPGGDGQEPGAGGKVSAAAIRAASDAFQADPTNEGAKKALADLLAASRAARGR